MLCKTNMVIYKVLTSSEYIEPSTTNCVWLSGSKHSGSVNLMWSYKVIS